MVVVVIPSPCVTARRSVARAKPLQCRAAASGSPQKPPIAPIHRTHRYFHRTIFSCIDARIDRSPHRALSRCLSDVTEENIQ